VFKEKLKSAAQFEKKRVKQQMGVREEKKQNLLGEKSGNLFDAVMASEK